MPSVRRNPFQASRSTQAPPSSSFGATPRFQVATPRFKDDIQAGFDDETDTPPPSRSHVSIDSGDVIDAEDDEDSGEHYSSPLYDKTAEAKEFIDKHVEIQSSPLQHRQKTSIHASKRRKIFHTGIGAAEHIIRPSPREDNQSHQDHLQFESDSLPSHSDFEDDLALPAPCMKKEESGRFAQFRPLAAESADLSPMPRAMFRTSTEAIPPGQRTGGPALPEIFTPSRRASKRDFLPGGSADLVRSWVLAIPAQESRSQSLSEQIISIQEIRHDPSGRFATAVDDSGSRWLLPEQEKLGTGPRRSLSILRPGAQVLVKGQATRWGLPVESHCSQNVTVAAYWEVNSPD